MFHLHDYIFSNLQILPTIGYTEIIDFHNWEVNSKNPYQEYVDNKGPKSYQFESMQKVIR